MSGDVSVFHTVLASVLWIVYIMALENLDSDNLIKSGNILQ